MDAEVEEMTRDRRNNILIHGLPVQEGQRQDYRCHSDYLVLSSSYYPHPWPPSSRESETRKESIFFFSSLSSWMSPGPRGSDIAYHNYFFPSDYIFILTILSYPTHSSSTATLTTISVVFLIILSYHRLIILHDS